MSKANERRKELKIFGKNLELGKDSVDIGNIRIIASVIRDDGFRIEFSLENLSNNSNFVGKFELGELDSSNTLFINNYQSWGPCTFVKPKEVFASIQKAKFPAGFAMSPVPEEFKKGLISDYFIASDKEFAGFLSSRHAHPYFLWKNGIIEIKIHVGKTLEAGEKLELDPLWLKSYDSLEEVLDKYAQKVATQNIPRIGKPVFGWSSWYDYYLDISQKAFLDELKEVRDLKMNYELFQIDDGYESDIGDWLETNEKFPEGLEFIAKKIRELGMIPGIWTAPFSVSETSNLFKDHPDWIVRDKSGKPLVAYENWNKKIYALDTTNPNALNWLEGVFSTLKNYGFDFFKIDFLFAGMISGNRHLDDSPVEAYRMGMEKIRKAVGDSHILGCGAPLLSSIGYVDSMRIGADTALNWNGMDVGQPSAKYSIRNALTRHFMNDVWWTNDPDCAMARSRKAELTSHSLSASPLKNELKNERMVNVYVPALLNGHFIESDKLSKLSQGDIHFLKSALNFRNGRSHVEFVDPERYVIVSKKTINGDVISFVNLSDSPWNLKIEEFSSLLSKKEEEFFISYPSMREINRFDVQNVDPHSILIVLYRGKRKISREDEGKEDGRDFHYYGSDDT